MIEEQEKPDQFKKFGFFTVDPINEKIDDPKLHPMRISDIVATQICMVDQKIVILDGRNNRILIFIRCVEGYWTAHTQATLMMCSSSSNNSGILLTYGQDSQGQMKSMYFKLWKLSEAYEDYSQIKPKKKILIGTLGDPQHIVSAIHFLSDLSLLAIGTKKGTLNLYESKNLIDYDYKMQSKLVQKRQIKKLQVVKRAKQYQAYFTSQGSFYWLENLNEKKRINHEQVETMIASKRGVLLIVFKSDPKTIFQYKSGKQQRKWAIDGQNRIIQSLNQFRDIYIIVNVFEKRNQSNEMSKDKYHIQVIDILNYYYAFSETYSKVENVLANDFAIIPIINNPKGERLILSLTEKENSFKIQTFFKKSFFNEARRFAKNQNCQPSLLSQISRLHGDQLYARQDYANAIKQYTMALGYLEPSYVIRRFLQVSQIDYLIQYLQSIHEKKMAKKQHTALLLNCYVKKQKIDNLSNFLSQSALESDLFDIETAIKVCKDLQHTDQAMRLAQQKNMHKLFLKILIEDKKDHNRALEHIRLKVQMEEKQKYIIQFGQQFMKYVPQKTIYVIKLLIKVNSISQIIRGRQRQISLSAQEKGVLQQLNFSPEQLQSLTVITFKKPDEYFRLFLMNNNDLQDFLQFLVRDIARLPNQQVVFHRLIEFYLEMMKQVENKKQFYENKILENINHSGKKFDNNHLLTLFKMYEFDQGVVQLCKKLCMRDDLLNFYIAKNRDQDILDLCKEHGVDEINLWIHALKYFVKQQNSKQHYIPDILKSLSLIPNLSPLPILSILSKNKYIEYRFVKDFFLAKLREDRQQIERDKQTVSKNIRKTDQSRQQFKKIKTTAKPFISNLCAQCQNSLLFPSLHFMCGHSFHESCLSGDKQCSRCSFDMKNIIQRKQRYNQNAQNQNKLFETLHERRQAGFEVISEYLGRGLFSKLQN